MFKKVFGANVDWISQHSVLPEYFRQQFYSTGNLFPEFTANIGGGQNIYNFSYHVCQLYAFSSPWPIGSRPIFQAKETRAFSMECFSDDPDQFLF